MRADSLGDAFIAAAACEGLGVRFWSNPGQSKLCTYADILEDALRFAAGLKDMGVQHGERIALVLSTSRDFYVAFFGATLAGATPTALYPPARLGRVEEWKLRTAKMLTAAGAVVVITERRLLPLLGEPVSLAGPRFGSQVVSSVVELGATLSQVVESPASIAAIQFSSGSTAAPKPVALSHENMLSNARTILDALPVPVEERSGVSWLPLYHDMGLVGCLLSAVVSQSPMTLMGPEHFVARPVRWLQALSETQATISVAPNFAFGLTASKAKEADLEGLDLSNWRVALCGAEPVHPRTLEDFSTRFGKIGFQREAITPVYGLAEATLAVTFSDPASPPRWTHFDGEVLDQSGLAQPKVNGRCLSSLGRPLEGCDISIRDAMGQEVASGVVGEVFAKSPGVMLGYLDQPEATEQTLTSDGWLRTGDTGFVYDGELYLCGRSKDLVIMNGRNHDPALVEQALDGIDGVRTGCVAAFATFDNDLGTETLVVLAERAKMASVETDAVEAEVRAAIHKTCGLKVSNFQLLEPGTLPRTSSGKIRRREAQFQWRGDTLRPGREPSAVGLAIEMARGYYHHLRYRARQASRRFDRA